jgi:hypothetical protein
MFNIRFLFVCAIAFMACNQEKKLPDQVTYEAHIKPLLQTHCNYCHYKNSGHLPLTSFADAKRFSSSIKYVVDQRIMPPWPADPHYSSFLNQRVLDEYDKQLITKWIKDGLKEGDKSALNEVENSANPFTLEKPDLVLAVTPTYIKQHANDQFLVVKVPFELPNETYVSVIEFVPGKHQVVHHVNGDLVKYDDAKKKNVFGGVYSLPITQDSTIKQVFEKMDLPNDDGTYPILQKSVVNYLPGVYAQIYKNGIGGYLLPKKGCFLLNDLHYGTSKTAIWDSSYIRIYFAKTPPKRPLQEFQLGTLGVAPVLPNLLIFPNTVKKVHSQYIIPNDISLVTINPHMHLLGKSFKAYAVIPKGDTIPLIHIPNWDFNWQYFYTFRKLLKIPKGSLMIAEGVYDNTTKNLLNPFTPPQLISDNKGSMKTTDEMFQFIVSYVPYKDGDENIDL